MKKEEKMVPLEEAGKVIKGFGKPSAIEDVLPIEALGRVLGEDIYSPIEMPPFNKSAMDGYAVISGDNPEEFEVIETIPAGKFPEKEIRPGQCSRIMTGAPLPPGSDRVIKIEVTEEKNGFMKLTGEDTGFNVCIRGEDIKKGDKVLKRGTIIRAPEIGAIASLGYNNVKVYKKVNAGIITTGSEIVEPGEKLPPGSIYNSNGYSISAQLISSGVNVAERKIIEDDKKKILDSVRSMMDRFDLVIISGGVSMGEFDYVPEILEELGVKIHFNKVAIQPGKPTLFGTLGDKVVFGLPGNPVSTFVVFEIVVKPLLARMSGAVPDVSLLKGVLKTDFKRKKIERDLFVPVYYGRDGFVELIEYHGSAHFVSLSKANGLLKINKGIKEISGGTKVDVRPI